jgi:hypothetical protein
LNWKGCGRKRPWPDFKKLSRHSPERTEENHESLSLNRQFPGRYFNPRPPKYEAGFSTTLQRRSLEFTYEMVHFEFRLAYLALPIHSLIIVPNVSFNLKPDS